MTAKPDSLTTRVSEMVSAAGIDNFHMDGGVLVMCGTRYIVEQCRCADPDCSGFSLRVEDAIAGGPSFAMQ